ncbi:hypothetical protein FVER53590_02548 [Fusarium verticillioides]|nr:hypothetical protein FVER53590_02548 [Fusarium verticillioides]
MDGTYNNPYAQGQSQSPLSPQTPGGYQVNVNRTKTRKWVQAPTQNYDGDDWGADEFEDDEPPPPPPVPRVTTGLRPVGQRTESFGPSPRLAAAVASSSRSSSNAPSLQLQTNHPDVPNPGHPEQSHNVSSPVTGRTGSPAPLSSGPGSSKAPSYDQQPDVRSSTPQSTASSAARGSPSIRPDFRHIDDERKLGGSPLSVTENIAPRPDDHSTPPVNEPNQPGYGRGDGPAIDKVQKQPTFDAILAKREELGLGSQGLHDPPTLDSIAPPEPASHTEETVIHSPVDIDRKRLSVSPQLPDVARMSVFGADFFSSGNKSSGPASVQDPTKQDQPSVPSQATDSPGNLATLEEKPRESEDNASTPGPNSSTSLAPVNDPRAVPPLRTPSPNSKGLFPSPREPTSATDSKITPTEPLHPRQPDYSPSNYEPNSALTQGSLNTFNSSPVKESDVLSEEIMRSLSPIAPTPSSAVSRPLPGNAQSLTPGDRGVTRNSSYTLSDYDSYWADSNEKPAQDSKTEAEDQEKPKTETSPVHEQKQQPIVQPLSSAVVSTETQPIARPESLKSDSRRRFSWEAGFDSPTKILPVEPPSGTFNNEALRPASPSPLAPVGAQSPKDEALDVASQTKETPQNVETPRIVIPPSGGISHQVSKASTLPPSQQPAPLEPPSPVSIENDDATPRAIDNRRPSVAENKSLNQVPSNLTSASPPPDKSTKALPPSQFPQTTPWRDIMSLATPVQRTLKFEAGLATHRAWDSGLENWLSNLMTEHPEYANGTSSFSGAGVPTSQKGHASGPSLSHNQQPYYQQYLNASSPTTGPPPGRSRLGGSVPSGTSGFGNSSNQIGTKGKELMQSAGKMGKGLFSKGKSKLRGTGDKGEPISPVQTKFKAERRASWGLDRLTRSRADDSSDKDVVISRPSTQSYHAPQSSQSSSMLQFGSVPSTGESGKRLASRESYGPQLSQDPAASTSASASASISAPASKENDDRSQWFIPTPIDESTWDPFKGTDLAKGKASQQSGAMLANQGHPQGGSSTQMPSSNPMSGGATPTPASGGIRMVPPEDPAHPSPQPTSVYSSVISQAPMTNAPQSQSPTQPHDPSAMVQRHSSFVGLPPIRRGSTFDVNSRSTATEQRTTQPIVEHVTAEPEDLDEIARQQGTLTSEVTVGSTLVGTDSIMEEKFKKDVDGSEPQSPPPQQSPRHSLQQSPPRGPQHPFQMHPVQPGPMPPQTQGYQPPTLPLLPPQLMGGPVQRLPPSGPWKLEESHLSEPLHRVTPKPQAVPPSGQWKLEESHLAEPLHMVNRNRAGTNASQISQLSQRSQRSQQSQNDPFYGYNKETGEVPPSPSSSSTANRHHQRQKPSEVPPSSANRYPGLFPGHQRQPSGSKDVHPGPGSQFIRRFSQEGIARTGTGDTTNEDRGRSKKASALLKDIGHRFRKSSTERRSTPMDHHGRQFHPPQQQQQLQPPHADVHHDAASVSSVTTDGTHDKKNSRASFMLGLRSKQSRERLSMPPPPRPDDSRPATSTEERRGSRLNPDFDPASGQYRLVGPPRAATSNMTNEMSQSAIPPAKKRFSAFNTKAAMTNVFNRPSSGTSSKPGTPTSSRPISSHLGAQQPVSLERPAHPGFERSSTAGPTFNQMLPTPTGTPPVDANERRKRRGSAAGLISGLLGHVHKSKESQQATSPQMQQPYDRRASGSQLGTPHPPALQTQGRRPSGPQLDSPVLPGRQLGSPQGSAPPLASPQPQRPHQFGNQQSISREQSPMSAARPLSGGIRDNQHAQAAYRNSRPSPLGFGSTTPAGTPPIGSVTEGSRHGTPQTPFSVGQSVPDARAGRMRSISPAASAIRSAPTTQTSFNVPSTAPTTQPSFHHASQSSQSLDKLAHAKQEGTRIQRPVTDSPNMSFRHENRASHGASDSDMPLSPVSQISKTGPPSVSSMATQSPRLNTTTLAAGRRQSSQLSQPDTPVVSAVSASPQHQTFANRMGVSPPQQHQQFPSGFQQQHANAQQQAHPQMNPPHGGYQITPGQQYEPNLRQPSAGQPMPGSYPQASSPGHPSMQMQHSGSGPPVPPKDSSGALQQPQVANQPARQPSPGASKWKGLRNRMSAQVSNKPAASQRKGENDKLTASKILGAFKRGSKENRQSMVIPDLQAYQNHEMRPVQRQQQPQQAQQAQRPQQPQIPQQQFAGQVPHGQTQSPRPSSQVSSQPFGQVPTVRPSSQFSNQSMGQAQTKRYSSMFTSPIMPQQEFRSPSGAYASGPQGMSQPQPGHPYQSPQMEGQFPPTQSSQAQYHSPPQPHGQFQSPVQQQGHFQSPAQPQGQFVSPPMQQGQFTSPMQHQGRFHSPAQQQGQFQSPPQPSGQWQPQMPSPAGQFPPPQQRQASYPGQWHGGTIGQSPNTPSSYRSPQHSQFSSQPQNPQYGFPTAQNVHGEESPPVHVSTPTQVHSPTPVHAPSPRPSLLNLQAMVAANPEHDHTQEGERECSDAAPRNDPNATHQGTSNMQRFHSDSPHSGRTSGSPRVGGNPPSAQHVSPRIGTEQNGSSKSRAPSLPMPVLAGGDFMGGHAAHGTSSRFSSKAEESQGVSLSPPSGAPGSVSPNSTRQSPSGGSDLGPPEPKSRGGPSFHAELEDTEGARKRTLRIDSQEEKIHYDPNADSDGEVPPQMSATSYPGQEWNPYGMPEMGDWNEATDR